MPDAHSHRHEDRGGRAAVLTVSDGVAHGTRWDDSGAAAQEILESASFEVVERTVVPDERREISSAMRAACKAGIDVLVTTGGTGLGPRDVTPEATREVIEREAPGLAELMRATGLATTAHAALSRGVANASERRRR